MADARLITIPISHFCEKARWILDFTGLAYREERHAPVLHLRATRPAGGSTVPLLVHDDDVLVDSVAIARHAERLAPAERRLVPEEPEARSRVLALERELGDTLGIDARLLAYWYMLGDPELARPFVGRMMGLRAPVLQRIATPLFRGLIFGKYRVSPAAVRRAEDRVQATFQRLGETLDREPYLVGGRFTLADLTLASLASPLLGPPEHPITGKLVAPPKIAQRRKELLGTTVGRHVLRVYREHRAAKARP
jgi:glutathione S-transferase